MNDSIHVWTIRLDRSPDRNDLALLSAEEKRRAAALRHDRDRRRWHCAHIAIRKILATYIDEPAARIRFTTESNRKPVLAEMAGGSRIHFNLSHSHELALFAVTSYSPVGIDIEYVRPFDDMHKVAARVFTPGELNQLNGLPAEEFVLGFYAGWTRKEALIKATGQGLAVELQAIEVSMDPREAPRILKFDQEGDTSWQLHDLATATSYRAAIAVAGAAGIKVIKTNYDS